MIQRIAILILAFTVAGCAREWSTDYTPTPSQVSRDWRVVDVRVSVPDTLTTSENNTFAPNFDIVWHGEPFGDRRAQVRDIMTTALRQGARGLSGPRPVAIEATVAQFHAVTPAAVNRAPSAVHDIRYVARVVDARTGAELLAPQTIQADLPANVGASAAAAAAQGETQKVRITRHLTNVTRGWLGIGPDMRATFTSIGR